MKENNDNKNDEIKSFSSKTNNKMAYLLLVEDVSVTKKQRAFIGTAPAFECDGVVFKGYEISWSDKNKIQSFDDALKIANKNNSPKDAIEIRYFSDKVINIRNVCYKRSDV